jgi:hypothetical protein
MGYSEGWLGWFGPGFFAIGLCGFFAAGLLVQASRQWYLPAERVPGTGPVLREVEVVTQT